MSPTYERNEFNERMETVSVPRQIFAPRVDFSPHERLLLTALIYFWEQREIPDTKPFQVPNADLVWASGISWRSIPAVRRRLVEKGLISFVRGGAGRTTEYVIHWDRIGQKVI